MGLVGFSSFFLNSPLLLRVLSEVGERTEWD